MQGERERIIITGKPGDKNKYKQSYKYDRFLLSVYFLKIVFQNEGI